MNILHQNRVIHNLSNKSKILNAIQKKAKLLMTSVPYPLPSGGVGSSSHLNMLTKENGCLLTHPSGLIP